MRCGWLLTCLALSGCDAIFDLEKVNYTPPPPCEPRNVATGRNHTCAIDYTGSVRCWGKNADGEVQPGGSDVVLQPTAVSLPSPAIQVALGREFTCARLEDGSVWCWGASEDNQIGAGVDVHPTTTVQVPNIPASAEISAGGYHACSRSAGDGTVWCWGGNRDGESGQTTSADCEPGDPDQGQCIVPTAVPGTTGAKAISLGHRHSCMIDSSDRVRCWGYNEHGQLGTPDGPSAAEPTLIAQIGTAIAISASGRSTCAVETSGSMKCWGLGDNGQLATGAFTAQAESPPVGTEITNARSIALGNFGGCSLLSDGRLSCWGNHDGGYGAYTTSASPMKNQLTNVRQIASHFFHSCAIVNGEVSCWGSNTDGQLGRRTRSLTTTPQPVDLPGATQIVAGHGHTCALTNGQVLCWGDNDFGQSGDGSLTRVYTPTPVPLSITPFGIAAGFNQTCAWGQGAGQCWGKAYTGRLGTNVDQRSQTPSPTVATGIDHIAVGGDHMCVVHQSPVSIECFGYNGQGQTGADPATTNQSPTGQMVPNSNAIGGIVKLVAGGRHNCLITATSVYCWGRGADGQLGNGSKNNQFTLQQVPGFVATDIAAGEDHSCLVQAGTGSVYCWGRNANGQLGQGDRTTATTPQLVTLPGPAEKVYSGPSVSHTCAKLVSGPFYCWGDGDFGQLGVGGMQDELLPTLVSGFAMATAAAPGRVGTCAIVGGQVRCTGEWRMLANGDASLSMPTAVDLGIGACPLD